MTLSDAVTTRVSQRSYLSQPLSPEDRQELGKLIEQCSVRSGLDIRLVCDDPAPFASLAKSYGLFKGVRNYLLFAGPADDADLDEKCGYFGQQIILTATAMGLGTCWVGGTYGKSACEAMLPAGERLVCAAAIGYVPGQPGGRDKLIRGAVRRAGKSGGQLSGGAGGAPSWFMSGIAAVQRAPSARNRQGYRFIREAGGAVRAEVTEQGDFSLVDLGIAKLHFELGAHGGSWTWGDGGVFQKAAEEKSCGAVIWRQGEAGRQYLLARHNGGHWSFPKGHVEGAETEAETAAREIREETGLRAQIDTSFRQVVTYYPKSGVIKDVVFFLATVTGGDEHAQEEEIAEIGWFSFQEARERITFASDEEVLLEAEKRLAER